MVSLVLGGYESACMPMMSVVALPRFASDKFTVWWVDCISIIVINFDHVQKERDLSRYWS